MGVAMCSCSEGPLKGGWTGSSSASSSKRRIASRLLPCPSTFLLEAAVADGFEEFRASEQIRELHSAALQGHVVSFQQALAALASSPWHRACDRAGNTALHAAVNSCHLHIANELLRNRALPNARNLRGESPLHLACDQSSVELTRLLLSARADPRLGDLEGNRAPGLRALLQRSSWWSQVRHEAVPDSGFLERRLDTLKLCLEAMESWDHDAPPAASLLNNHGETALHFAASVDDAETCRLLIHFQAQLDHPESLEGRTPLMCALRAGAFTVVRCLLDALADPNQADTSGGPALHYAASRGDSAVKDAAELLKRRAEANAVDGQGATALARAASAGAPEMVRFLLRRGAKPQSCRPLLPQIAHPATREILLAVL